MISLLFFNFVYRMETPEEIDKLSNERLEKARILFENGKFDGAYYLIEVQTLWIS